MGSILACCASDSEEQRKLDDRKIKIPSEIIITSKIKKAVKKMKLRKKELIYLWNCFSKMGITDKLRAKKTTHNTFITKLILARHLKQPFDTFYSNLYDRWDLDRNGNVTFDEFLIGCYKFLLSKPSKYIEYVFQTFDSDGDGYLYGAELRRVLEELHGINEFQQMTAKTAMILYDRKRDGKIDLSEFEEAIKNYPVIMWRVTLCKNRFLHEIADNKLWYKLYCRLHPELVNQHQFIWRRHLRENYNQCKSYCRMTKNVCIKLFQCIMLPICPCLKKTSHIDPRYMEGHGVDGGDELIYHHRSLSNPTDVSLQIADIISNTGSPSKRGRTRIEKSKIDANIFSDTQQVQKRLDLEVLGDHDSSDSDMRQYLEKETRGQRMRKRQR